MKKIFAKISQSENLFCGLFELFILAESKVYTGEDWLSSWMNIGGLLFCLLLPTGASNKANNEVEI